MSTFNVYDTTREIPELVVADASIDSLNTNTLTTDVANIEEFVYGA